MLRKLCRKGQDGLNCGSTIHVLANGFPPNPTISICRSLKDPLYSPNSLQLHRAGSYVVHQTPTCQHWLAAAAPRETSSTPNANIDNQTAFCDAALKTH